MGNDPKLARLERRRRALLREQQQLVQDNTTLHSKAAVLGAWCQCFQFLKSAGNVPGLVDGASTLLAAEEQMLLQQLRAADVAGAVAAKGLAPLTVPGTIAPQGKSGFVAGHAEGAREGRQAASRAPVEGRCWS